MSKFELVIRPILTIKFQNKFYKNNKEKEGDQFSGS